MLAVEACGHFEVGTGFADFRHLLFEHDVVAGGRRLERLVLFRRVIPDPLLAPRQVICPGRHHVQLGAFAADDIFNDVPEERLIEAGLVAGDDERRGRLILWGGAGDDAGANPPTAREMSELVRAFDRGDLARARELHYRLLPLLDVLFCETNPIPLKAAMHLLGRASDEIRLPLTPLTERNRERLQVVLKELGLL